MLRANSLPTTVGATADLNIDFDRLLKRLVEIVDDPREVVRRKLAAERVSLYLDDNESTVRCEIDRIFNSHRVKRRAQNFAHYGASQSLLKRISNEIGRMVYSIPPIRTVSIDGVAGSVETKAYVGFCKSKGLNRKLDLVARLITATNQAGLFVRKSNRLGWVIDVVTPNQYVVLPDPDDVTRELAVMFIGAGLDSNGRVVTTYDYWDRSITFQFYVSGRSASITRPVYEHGLGVLPFVSVRAYEAWGCYWDDTRGTDLLNGQRAVMTLSSLVMKLHKAQGEKQPVVNGQLGDIAKNQVFDAEEPLCIPANATFGSIDLVTDPGHYWKSIDAIAQSVASNYGISADRLRAKSAAAIDADENQLIERRDELIRVFADAERQLFALMQRLDQSVASQAGVISIDFADATYRGDRKSALDVAERERKLGICNTLDLIRARQPECETEEEAWAEFVRNVAVETKRIVMQQVLNASSQGDASRSPEENGALGAAVREAKAMKDDAMERASDDAIDPSIEIGGADAQAKE